MSTTRPDFFNLVLRMLSLLKRSISPLRGQKCGSTLGIGSLHSDFLLVTSRNWTEITVSKINGLRCNGSSQTLDRLEARSPFEMSR